MGVVILLIQATTAMDTAIIEVETIIETIIAQIRIEKAEELLITSLEGQILEIQEITNLNIILIIEIILQDIDKIMILETFNQVFKITNRVDF
jgi:hypothetical protein